MAGARYLFAVMGMMRFALFFPELAIEETRCVTTSPAMKERGRVVLPADDYALDEWYCVDPDCDCRRVLFNILAGPAQTHVATISHGFEPPDDSIQPPEQTFLDEFNKQSEWSRRCWPWLKASSWPTRHTASGWNATIIWSRRR